MNAMKSTMTNQTIPQVLAASCTRKLHQAAMHQKQREEAFVMQCTMLSFMSEGHSKFDKQTTPAVRTLRSRMSERSQDSLELKACNGAA
mmetsp:Transcript_9302/g.10480  ORF Transcript_9302/g.10480 Transcript_9302/m.10480 type:complete len:89 (+) Transcript_9302:67-333(+)